MSKKEKKNLNFNYYIIVKKGENMKDLSFLTIKNKKNFTNWLKIIKPFLESKEFQRRKLLFHHENQSLWHHCVKVSFLFSSFTAFVKLSYSLLKFKISS